MLDLSRQLILPEFPLAQVYGDHESAQTFYLIPWAPALELNEQGAPEARFLIYLERKEGQKIPTGGQLSMTTILDLPSQDWTRIKQTIATQVARTRPGPPSGQNAIQLSAPEWLSGSVEIRFTESWTISAQPSLLADNRCALSTRLDADRARMLLELWKKQLPDARIAYRLTMRVADAAAGSLRTSDRISSEGPGDSAQRHREIAVDVRAVGAVTKSVTLESPLWSKRLESLVTEIDLSR
jgi:hypothetical protein